MRVVALALLAACSGLPAAADAGAGGSIFLPAPCGYEVTTRPGASPPVPGSDVLGDDPTPRQIHLGLAADPARSMVVLWRTGDERTLATTVQLGKAAVGELSVSGLTYTFGDARMHEAHLCGLDPDTEYRYRVGGDGAWSPEYTFRTAPDPATQPAVPVTAVVLGDARDDAGLFAQLLSAAVEQVEPDLLIFTGDAVTNGGTLARWDAFFDAAEGQLRSRPLLSAHGNHEANSVIYYSMNAHPAPEDVFALDYGPLHLVFLNDSPIDPAAIAGDQRDFLDADLTAAAAAPWKIVVHHRPTWSAGSGHGSDIDLRAAWAPVIDAHHVDLVLNGHDHNYERSKPIRDSLSRPTPAEGTIYVVAGAAGADLHVSGTGWWTAVSEATPHFVVLRAMGGQLDAQAFRLDGTMLDAFSIGK